MPILMDRRGFLAASAGFIALHPFSARAQAGQAHLRIMETTDIHVHVFPYDYYGDRPVDTVGTRPHRLADRRDHGTRRPTRCWSTTGTSCRATRWATSSPMSAACADGVTFTRHRGHERSRLRRRTLGNHEFNYGLDFLMNSVLPAPISRSSAPTCQGHRAGGERRATTRTVPKPYVDPRQDDHRRGRRQTHPIRIGFIGFVPPQIMTWDRRHLEGSVNVRDIVAAAQAYVPQMREEGAEIWSLPSPIPASTPTISATGWKTPPCPIWPPSTVSTRS
jgi:2',3'-cyclic-nucleotide 2'-phosphodiesterase/3'-nucleotidase